MNGGVDGHGFAGRSSLSILSHLRFFLFAAAPFFFLFISLLLQSFLPSFLPFPPSPIPPSFLPPSAFGGSPSALCSCPLATIDDCSPPPVPASFIAINHQPLTIDQTLVHSSLFSLL